MSNRYNSLAIIQATLFAYQLPFNGAIQFKQHSLSYREGLILRLTDSRGVNHYSEITPLPGFSHETLAEVKQEIISLLSTPLSNLLKHQSRFASLQFALDSLSYRASKKQHAMVDNIPLLQGDKQQVIAQYIALNKPNIIKLKVARESVATDVSIFQTLCALNPKLKIRCDANQAWNEPQAEQFFSSINVLQLDYIEEPSSDHQLNLLLAEKYQLPIALDETLQQPDFSYQHHSCIKAFIIKPTIIGSKEKIDQLVSIASIKGIAISFSSSFESIVGLQQLKQLANLYTQNYPQLTISLGIDTLKYFNSELLMKKQNIEQDCQHLEMLCTSN